MKIFVASTGRCGTVFMSEVMRKLTCIPSFHEPLPWCVDDTLREVNDVPSRLHSASTKEELEAKRAQVERDTMDGWYFESNQMFIKSYYHLFAQEDIGVIYLWRNPMDTLISYAKKCWRREDGWFLKSHWNYNILQTAEQLTFYENVLWQWYEIRERYHASREHFGATYEFPFTKLNSVEEWKKMLAHFDIPHRKFNKLPNVKRNEIVQDETQVLRAMRDNWEKPSDRPASHYEYGRKEALIDFAKRQVAINSAEVNQCRD